MGCLSIAGSLSRNFIEDATAGDPHLPRPPFPGGLPPALAAHGPSRSAGIPARHSNLNVGGATGSLTDTAALLYTIAGLPLSATPRARLHELTPHAACRFRGSCGFVCGSANHTLPCRCRRRAAIRH